MVERWNFEGNSRPDPEKAILFQQSHVHQHAELNWILICLLTESRLQRLSQFKQKASNLKEVPLGLLLYPALQALIWFVLESNALSFFRSKIDLGQDLKILDWSK